MATATGQSTLAYARAKLFKPLGIRTDGAFEPVLGDASTTATIEAYERASVAWPVDPQGYHYGAAFLRLPARDLAKFGYLYLNGGRWDGNQLIPADYVAAATSPAARTPNLSMGYGWHWWVAYRRWPPHLLRSRLRRPVHLRRPRPGPRNRHHQRPRDKWGRPQDPDHSDHSPGRHQLMSARMLMTTPPLLGACPPRRALVIRPLNVGGRSHLMQRVGCCCTFAAAVDQLGTATRLIEEPK